MADLSEFSRDDFSPEAWINNACIAKPSEEAMDRSIGFI